MLCYEMEKLAEFDKTYWPNRAAFQNRWHEVTRISTITLQKARERGVLKAKAYRKGLNIQWLITRADFEDWIEKYYRPSVRVSAPRNVV